MNIMFIYSTSSPSSLLNVHSQTESIMGADSNIEADTQTVQDTPSRFGPMAPNMDTNCDVMSPP